MSVNVRPPGGSPTGVQCYGYSPARDLSNLYLPWAREVLGNLDDAGLAERTFPGWEAAKELTAEASSEALVAFSTSLEYFTRHAETASVDEALEAGGFANAAPAAKQLILGQMGAVTLAGFWLVLRDVVLQGVEAPQDADLAEAAGAAAASVTRLRGVSGPAHPPEELATALAHVARLRATLEQAQRFQQGGVARLAGLERRCGPLIGVIEGKTARQRCWRLLLAIPGLVRRVITGFKA